MPAQIQYQIRPPFSTLENGDITILGQDHEKDTMWDKSIWAVYAERSVISCVTRQFQISPSRVIQHGIRDDMCIPVDQHGMSSEDEAKLKLYLASGSSFLPLLRGSILEHVRLSHVSE
jgi:hypothetical protein